MGFTPWRSFLYALCLLSVLSIEVEVTVDEMATATASAPPMPISETVTRYEFIARCLNDAARANIRAVEMR